MSCTVSLPHTHGASSVNPGREEARLPAARIHRADGEAPQSYGAAERRRVGARRPQARSRPHPGAPLRQSKSSTGSKKLEGFTVILRRLPFRRNAHSLKSASSVHLDSAPPISLVSSLLSIFLMRTLCIVMSHPDTSRWVFAFLARNDHHHSVLSVANAPQPRSPNASSSSLRCKDWPRGRRRDGACCGRAEPHAGVLRTRRSTGVVAPRRPRVRPLHGPRVTARSAGDREGGTARHRPFASPARPHHRFSDLCRYRHPYPHLNTLVSSSLSLAVSFVLPTFPPPFFLPPPCLLPP